MPKKTVEHEVKQVIERPIAEVVENILNVRDAEIPWRRPQQGCLSFGKTTCRNVVHLPKNRFDKKDKEGNILVAKNDTQIGEQMGFINALLHYAKDYYPVCIPGFHMKVTWEEVKDIWETPYNKPYAYVDFTLLDDKDTIAKLKACGITQRPEDKRAWLALKIVRGKFVPWFRVEPKIWTDLLNGRNVEDLDPNEKSNNDRLWRTLYKHDGLELAMKVYRGVMRVVLYVLPRQGWEWHYKALENKIAEIYMPEDEYQAHRSEKIADMNAQNTIRVGEGYVKTKPVVAEAADQLMAQGIVVTYNGQEMTVTPDKLVKAKVQHVRGSFVQKGTGYLKNLDQVRGAVVRCSQMKTKLVVVSFDN